MPESSSFRLAPGVRLFPSPGGWLLALPGDEDRFVRVRAQAETIRRLADRLAGRTASATDEPDGASNPEVADLLERFVRAGYALPTGEPRASSLAGRRIALGGVNPIAESLAEILGAFGAKVRMHREEIPLAEPPLSFDLAILCPGELRDADLQTFDRAVRADGRAWHLCHPEGTRWFLGPLCRPGGLSYADVRARRLAATHRPTELMALWRALDRREAAGATSWPDPAACAALAAALAADAEAHLSCRPVPADGCQRSFDPASFSWRHHPVLPVPRDLWTAEPAETVREASA